MHFSMTSSALKCTSLSVLVLTILSFLNSAEGAPHPSPIPSCYVCPSMDIVDFPLSASLYTSSPFYCEYGEPQWHCTYDPVSGNLVQDVNEGLCPPTAVYNCPARRSIMRERALPRAAPAPAPTSVSATVAHDHKLRGGIQMRASLGEEKKRQK